MLEQWLTKAKLPQQSTHTTANTGLIAPWTTPVRGRHNQNEQKANDLSRFAFEPELKLKDSQSAPLVFACGRSTTGVRGRQHIWRDA